MKFFFLFLTVSFLLFVFVGSPFVLAQQTQETGQTPAGGTKSLDNPLGNVSFETVVQRAINYILGTVGVLGLIAFIYGGVEWLIAAGDTAKITKGKTIMVWAVWGMVVIFGSYAIIKFVFEALLAK